MRPNQATPDDGAVQLLAAIVDRGTGPAKRAAVCKALAALCQDSQSGMRLASAWLSRLLLHLAMDAKAHHSLKLVRPGTQQADSKSLAAHAWQREAHPQARHAKL